MSLESIYLSNLNNNAHQKPSNQIPIIQQTDIKRVTRNDSYSKTKISAMQNVRSDSKPNQKSNYLNIEVIQKMIHRFLIEKGLDKTELAKILGINKNSLEQILFQKNLSLVRKINLPLIKLYCETEWGKTVEEL